MSYSKHMISTAGSIEASPGLILEKPVVDHFKKTLCGVSTSDLVRIYYAALVNNFWINPDPRQTSAPVNPKIVTKNKEWLAMAVENGYSAEVILMFVEQLSALARQEGSGYAITDGFCRTPAVSPEYFQAILEIFFGK